MSQAMQFYLHFYHFNESLMVARSPPRMSGRNLANIKEINIVNGVRCCGSERIVLQGTVSECIGRNSELSRVGPEIFPL